MKIFPPGPLPPRADVTEPPQTEERRGEVEEKFGTLPAIAIGYHAPARGTHDWYAAAMLDRVLHGGRAGRVYRRLVLEKQIAVERRRHHYARRCFRSQRPDADGDAHFSQARIHRRTRRWPRTTQ